MRILLVVDGSSYSDIATRTLEALRLPPTTEVTVLTVIPQNIFLGGMTIDTLRGAAPAKKRAQRQKAAELLQDPVQLLSASGLKIESLVRWGDPAKVILAVAEKTNASLVVMGAKGLNDPFTFRLGSVTQKVMKHTKASVLLARKKTAVVSKGLPTKETTTTINRVLLAVDGSKYSDMATEFLLHFPLPQQTQITVVTALESHIAALMKMPTLDLETNQQLLADLQAAEEKAAREITTRSEERLRTQGYNTASIIVRGGAGESILKAARRYNPDIIALGSRGLTGIESFLLGSVAERVARYAGCSVLIVRSPKT